MKKRLALAGIGLAMALTPLATVAQPAVAAANNTLGGTVYDLQSGLPLSGICDQIEDVKNNYNVVGVQASQQDGTWQQQNLPTSTYTVEFFDCRAGDYPFLFLGATPLQAKAQQVHLAGGVTDTSLQIHMPPGGAVSGILKDSTTHQPIVDGLVEQFYASKVSGEVAYAGFSCTDSLGGWHMGGSPVSGVKVAFLGQGCNNETYSYFTRWYDQKGTFGGATPIIIQANQETTGIKITSKPSP
jgi:hypothetical protein